MQDENGLRMKLEWVDECATLRRLRALGVELGPAWARCDSEHQCVSCIFLRHFYCIIPCAWMLFTYHSDGSILRKPHDDSERCDKDKVLAS